MIKEQYQAALDAYTAYLIRYMEDATMVWEQGKRDILFKEVERLGRLYEAEKVRLAKSVSNLV